MAGGPTEPALRPDEPVCRQGWRARVLHVLTTADTPRRTATAFALGVFLSFSPLLGLQIAVGLGAAVALRLSRVALFAGLCTNLPWIMVPWYTCTTIAGAVLLRAPIRADVASSLSALFDRPVYRAEFWTNAIEVLSPFFWSFVVGSTAGAAIVGLAAYLAVMRAIAAARPAGQQT